MFIRDTSDPYQVVIIVESHHRRLESQMGRYDRWHALIHDSQYVVVISWTTSLPCVGVEVFDLESSMPDLAVDEMFHQENGVYSSLKDWDSLCRESDERIGITVWEEYQKYMIV